MHCTRYCQQCKTKNVLTFNLSPTECVQSYKMLFFTFLSATLMACLVRCSDIEVEGCDKTQLKACQALVPSNTPVGVPRTKDELDTLCSTYYRGMTCFDTWMQRCLPTDKQRIIEKDIGSARSLMRFLCGNGTALRTEFLKESACWSRVSERWSHCIRQFYSVTEDVAARAKQLTVFNKNTELCCAHDTYMRCVAVAGHVCSISGSNLLRRMAWVLSKDVASCGDHQPDRCSAPPHAHSTFYYHVTLTGILITIGFIGF